MSIPVGGQIVGCHQPREGCFAERAIHLINKHLLPASKADLRLLRTGNATSTSYENIKILLYRLVNVTTSSLSCAPGISVPSPEPCRSLRPSTHEMARGPTGVARLRSGPSTCPVQKGQGHRYRTRASPLTPGSELIGDQQRSTRCLAVSPRVARPGREPP